MPKIERADAEKDLNVQVSRDAETALRLVLVRAAWSAASFAT
ncbi:MULTISPECIES: hypothetical protein [unclassified Bradyrhizobium]|nr:MULTISPECIES: hypothetical protein [unclassified Bradyrhizobium]